MAELLPSEELVDDPSDFGSLKPGTRLGRYELLVPVARGGMARVWAARQHGHRGFSKLVAIKTILPHLAREPEFERMFLDEARIASGVHHPNVCEIYELGEEQRNLYLVMEWVSGDSLSRVLRASGNTQQIDPRVAARIVADACAGVHSAHELSDDEGRSLGVVHRDLSPHNILLTADGVAKVADFGVAKALGQLHDQTSAGQLKGKLAYMAPEQVQGAAIDRRSDVFSLGCVLYEATTGQRPFRGDGDHQVMHAVLKGEFPSPTSIIKGYPQELERVILRAMSAQPILRFPTAERMRFALEEFLTRGQLVTQSNVAQLVRARIGDQVDKRKERIRQVSTAGDRDGGWSDSLRRSEAGAGHTPSNQKHQHRSGVQQAPQRPAPPPQMYGTVTMASVDMPPGVVPVAGGQGAPPPTMGAPPATMASVEIPPGMLPSAGGPPPPTPRIGVSSMPPVPSSGPPPTAALMQTIQMMPPEEPPQSHPAFPASHPISSNPLSSTTIPQANYQPPPRMAMTLPLNQMAPLPAVGTPPPPPAAQNQDWSSPGRAVSLPPGSGAHDIQAMPQRMTAPIPWEPGNPEPAREPPQASTGQYAVAAIIGLVVAAVIGTGAFFVWRSRTHVEPPPIASATPPAPASAPQPGVVAASPEIQFKVTPADATLSVDGKELGADVRKLPRPAAGTTVMLVAHAKDHEDVTILVDYFTTSPVDIVLKPGASAAPVAEADAGTVSPAATTAAADPEGTKEKPKPKPKPQNKDPNGLPANPY